MDTRHMDWRRVLGALALAIGALLTFLGCVPTDQNSGQSSGGGVTSSDNTPAASIDNPFGLNPVNPVANEKILYAVADTYAESMSPTSNFGSAQALYTGFVNFGTGRDDYFTAFARFDLSGIPSGAQIEEARLKLTTDANASYVKPKGTVTIAMVTDTSWTESGLTYVNMPSTGEYVIAREITFDTATTWEFPVTGAVQKWMNGTTNRGFSIKSRNFSPDGQCYATFYANELASDGGPRLYVRWR